LSRRVTVVGYASDVQPDTAGRTDAELLAPVVDGALDGAGLGREDIDVIVSASSEFLNGVIGTVMGAFDALPGWPPRPHAHHEGDGAFAFFEAWIRLLAGEGATALVCAYSRPLAGDMAQLMAMQLDPYLVTPLGPNSHEVAALQARALIDAGRYDEADFARVVSERRPGTSTDDALGQPYVAAPLRAGDCSTLCAGAAAVVLAVDDVAADLAGRAAWISGIDQRVETQALGGRDLTLSPSTAAASARLGVLGSAIDVLEVHAPYSHQELIVVDSIGAGHVGVLNPSGGALAANPVMATGLIRIGEAASAVMAGTAGRAVAHATNGPCLQHNLVCALEAER
jgi:acetyl-CoA acetyltransferase